MTGPSIILDGYNLMFRDGTPQDASLEDAREAFLVHVASVRKPGAELIVVFDGVVGAGRRGASAAPAPAGMRVMWSKAPRTADDVIVRLVERHHRNQATVLTWDRELRHRVKSAGGVIGDPAAFLAPPRKPRRKGKPSGRAGSKPKPPQGAELEEWEQLFRDAEGGPRPD